MNAYKTLSITSLVFVLWVGLAFAAPVSETSVTITPAGTGGGVGSQTSLKNDGASCSVAGECAGNFCVHSICRSASTFCGDGSCDSGESTSSCSADCPAAAGGGGTTSAAAGGGAAEAPTPTPTPTPEPTPTPTPAPSVTPPVEVVTVNVPVTEAKTKQEVVTAIKPSDLGVSEIKIENVQVTKVGVAETTTPTQAAVLEKAVDEAIAVVTEEPAKQVLNEIKQSVSSGSSAPVSVSTMVEVFEVKEQTTGNTAFASKITLTLKPEKDLKDVSIVEVIPKSIAASISNVIFLGEQPKVLQADPVVQWEFNEVKKDETKDLSYQVAKKIDKLETETIAVSAVAPAAAPEKPSLTLIYIIGIVVAAGIVVYVLYKQFSAKGPRQFRYHYRTK